MGIVTNKNSFNSRKQQGLDNDGMRKTVKGAQERLHEKRLLAAEELGNWDEWRNHSEEIRQHVLENLDYYLHLFSENVAKQGGHVFFATTPQEATDYIASIVTKKQAKKIVKSKSMVTEEIHLNHALLDLGCDVLETDLGEYILQVDDWDPPSHIVAPALHKSKEKIRDVFQEKLAYDGTEQPEHLTAFVRQKLREQFFQAEIGITGCNFAVADTGSVCIVTNEGNGRFVSTMPKTLITVMGMERIVPSLDEVDILVSMLCRSAVGQKLTSYITLFTGTRNEGEEIGPEEFHIVIVDNGRSKILGTKYQSILQCIRCAACVNVCPVYRHIGGQAYGSIYSGPVGAVLSPLLEDYNTFKELPYASTLCAACTDACPVKIPLHRLLLEHRKDIVEREGRAPLSETMLMKAFGMGAGSPSMFNLGVKIAPLARTFSSPDGNLKVKVGPLKEWMSSREFPAPDKQSFRKWFKNRDKGGNSHD
ncbi:MAG: LutB/LldF family L-lactate oxidation iron-sulfur protein [Bacillaceae bacterium]